MISYALVVIYCSIKRLEMYGMIFYCPGYKIGSTVLKQDLEKFSSSVSVVSWRLQCCFEK